VWTALTLAGLEPFAGFLHVDRPGKPSLVLDFIEEFRQPVVDRVVVASLNKGFSIAWESPQAEVEQEHRLSPTSVGGESFPRQSPPPISVGGESFPRQSLANNNQPQRFLAAATRKAFAERVLERLESEVPFEGKRLKLKNVIQRQARHLATFLRREGDYRPYVSKW